MTRQKRHKMFFYADRTKAGAAPAMRDAKGLVKVEMADVSAISSRLRQPDLRVEIGAVEIDLSAMGMNDSANFANFGFEHAMRGWIVIITAARRLEYCSAFSRKSPRSTLPSLSQPITTTSIPAICADAGLVPWADDGIRQTVRCGSPRLA